MDGLTVFLLSGILLSLAALIEQANAANERRARDAIGVTAFDKHLKRYALIHATSGTLVAVAAFLFVWYATAGIPGFLEAHPPVEFTTENGTFVEAGAMP